MGIRGSNDPRGLGNPRNTTQLVDKLIGTAYDVVKEVSINIKYVKFLATNMEYIVNVEPYVKYLPVLVEQLGDIKIVAESITHVNAIGENIDNLLDLQIKLKEISENLDKLEVIYENLDIIAPIGEIVPEIKAVGSNIEAIKIVANDLDKIIEAHAGALAAERKAREEADRAELAAVKAERSVFPYLGIHSTPPTERGDASPLQNGDMYFNSINNTLNVYNGVMWNEATESKFTPVAIDFDANGTQLKFELPVDVIDASNIFVWVGGVRQVPFKDYTAVNNELVFIAAPSLDISGIIIGSATKIPNALEKTVYDPDGRKTDIFKYVDGKKAVFDTVADAISAYISESISTIKTGGYHSVDDGGAAAYYKKGLFEVDAAGDFVSNGGAVRWGLSEDTPNVLQIGCVADYNSLYGTGTDCGSIINKAFEKWSCIKGSPGNFYQSTPIVIPPYKGFVSDAPAGQSLGTITEAEAFINDKSRFVLVPRGLPKTNSLTAMITDCELSGGVVNNPNAGKDYTLSSGSRFDKFRITDFTMKDAQETSPATPRKFSSSVKLGHHSFCHGVVIRTTRKDGSFTSSADVMDWGETPDVGFFAENPYYAKITECSASWGFRIAALLDVNHRAGDGYYPQGDGLTVSGGYFEGWSDIQIRGADRCRVLSNTNDSITIAWFSSHQFKKSGTVRVGSMMHEYSDLVFSQGAPSTLTFSGMNVSDDFSGLGLIRGEDHDDWAVGEQNFNNVYLRGMTHASLLFPTDAAFSDYFESPSIPIVIGGSRLRGIRFNGLIAHPRDDAFMFINDATNVFFDGYAEPKEIKGTSSASGIICLSLEEKNSGRGGVPYPAGGATDIRFGDFWNQTLTIDKSPWYSPQGSVGRFGSDWNLCAPNGGRDYFSSVRSRDGTAIRNRAPWATAQKHPFQWMTNASNVRASMDQSGRWQFGFGLDTETALTDVLSVINNGGHLVRAVNTASATVTGFHAQNSSGNATFVIDSNGRGNLRTSGIGRLEYGSAWFSPMSDASLSNGRAQQRWKDIFAESGTISTSDARKKTWRGHLNSVEIEVAKKLSSLIGIFQWKDMITEKGDDARLHVGVTVQDVIAVFDSEGLNAFDYGAICYNSWDDEYETIPADVEVVPDVYQDGLLISRGYEKVNEPERTVLVRKAGDIYSLRHDELFAFIAAGFEARLSALEAE